MDKEFMKKCKYDRTFKTVLIKPIWKGKPEIIDEGAVVDELRKEWAKSGSELSFDEWVKI